MNKFIALIFISALIVSACQRDLDIPLPEHEPRLTLYTFLEEGKPIDLYVLKSFGILDKVEAKDLVVEDAKVELYKNGDLLDVLQYKDTSYKDTINTFYDPVADTFIYVTDFLTGAKYFPSKTLDSPMAGETYKFVVSHPTLGTAEGETTIPKKIGYATVSLFKDSLSFVDSYGDRTNWTALDLAVNDPIGLGDHYNFIVGVDYIDEAFDPDRQIQREWYWPGQEILSDPDGYTYVRNQPKSDEDFDGGQGQMYWWFTLPRSWRVESERPEYKKILIKGISMSAAYARFQDKLNLQVNSRLFGIENAFVPSESVVIPSNVEGGYGVIASYNVSDYTIDL
ncbi:MAG: DUF4249 family protein [Bacteroidota bacterium]